MGIKNIILSSFQALRQWPKRKLIEAIQILKERYIELEKEVKVLREENAKLKEELERQKVNSINKDANKPSSKQPEWEPKGVGNDGKGKKRKGRGHKPRDGADNMTKNMKPTQTEKATVDQSFLCGKDLTAKKAFKSTNKRIIKDIPEASFKPEIILVEQEKKYCNECKQVITARSELALPSSDIGIIRKWGVTNAISAKSVYFISLYC